MGFIEIAKEELDNKTLLLEKFRKEADKMAAFQGFSLDVRKKKSGDYYTVYFPRRNNDGIRERRYVGQGEKELVDKVKMHYALTQSIQTLQADVKLLQPVVDKYKEIEINQTENWPAAYRKLPAECYELAGMTDLHSWAQKYRNIHHIGDFRYPQDLKQTTEDGELVRSKSEAIIYNCLLRENLSFVYEMPLMFQGSSIEPDFTVYSRKTGQLIIWEHLGLLSSSEYIRKIQWKLRLFQQSGYILGDNLIFSTDTADHGIDTSEIMEIIKEYLI
ncbi:MAG: hypothetical protein ACI4W2_11600 [Eubacterium sp.]